MTVGTFEADGYALVPEILSEEECADITERIVPSATSSGGSRALLREDWCASLAARLRIDSRLADLAPEAGIAVQCTYFEKSRARNWIVPIHQDLSVPIAARVDDPMLSGWSEKEGQLFVQAPSELLAQMVALRVHLESCLESDGPLRVVPGSHRLGRIETGLELALRAELGEITCVAARGSVLAIRPLLLHASSKATGKSRRRVLHFLFGPSDLPCGLRWPQDY